VGENTEGKGVVGAIRAAPSPPAPLRNGEGTCGAAVPAAHAGETLHHKRLPDAAALTPGSPAAGEGDMVRPSSGGRGEKLLGGGEAGRGAGAGQLARAVAVELATAAWPG